MHTSIEASERGDVRLRGGERPSAGLTASDLALLTGLVNKHKDRLYRFILKHLGNPSEAEDLTQQTFLEAARSIAHFRSESAPSTWLFGIANNLIRNHLQRAPSRRYQFVDVEILTDCRSEEDTPLEDLERKRRMAALQAAIRSLPDALREALVLVALEGMPYEEAACVMGIPVGTVRGRLFRAREHLRKQLAETFSDLP